MFFLTAVILVPSPVYALSKGIATAEPEIAPAERNINSPGPPSIHSFAPEGGPLYALPADAFAVEVVSNVSRATNSWSEKIPVPLLGGVIRSVFKAGSSVLRFQKNLKANYGLTARRYGHSGVAVMMQRKF